MTEIPKADPIDNIRVALFHFLPYYLRGIFLRSRWWFSFLALFRIHPFGARWGNWIRQKYGSNLVYFSIFGRKSLLVFDDESLKKILDLSPEVFADSSFKKRGMQHFQPNAVTVSRGNRWQDRREFNDFVLADDSHSDAILKVVSDVASLPHPHWPAIQRGFEKLTLGIIFGKENTKSLAVSNLQQRLMRKANRILGLSLIHI